MIDETEYLEKVKKYFHFLLVDFNFKISLEKIRGNIFYDVQYTDKSKTISVSYENVEDYFLILIYLLENGQLPNYDDRSRTLRLSDLTSIVYKNVSKIDIQSNNEYFKKYEIEQHSSFDNKLLKTAKDLRLCLKYINKKNIFQKNMITKNMFFIFKCLIINILLRYELRKSGYF